jgi:modulator of FtsH protease HflK
MNVNADSHPEPRPDETGRTRALQQARTWVRRLAPAVLVLLAGLYLASGLCVVGPSEVGLVRQFGEITGEPMPPGLHYHWPWPFRTVETVEKLKSLSLEAGFWPAKPALVARAGPIPPGDRANLEQFCLTGDKNLIHARLTVQYSIHEPVRYLDFMTESEKILAAVVDSALIKVVGRMGVDAILTKAKRQVVDEVLRLAGERLKQIGSPLKITSLELTQAEAPEPVRGAFREVISAQMAMSTAVHRAQAKREQILAQAESEAVNKKAQAAAYAVRRESEVGARIARFDAMFEHSRGAEPLARRRLLLDTLGRVLPTMKKIVLPAGTQPTVKILTSPPAPSRKDRQP